MANPKPAKPSKKKKRKKGRARARSGGCLVQLLVLATILGLFAAGGAAATVLAFGAATLVTYQRYVVADPGPHLARAEILGSIAQESVITYDDGKTPVGVFFDQDHRVFVGREELPPAFVIALVAAEDGGFWSHAGIDPMGISRAMAQNVAAGRVVAGGSTLTQQTAKNLFKRPDRSFTSKLVEALDTLRLEAHYDKLDILTFYANLFYISGNGKGLGVGARYFFDVAPAELTVLQCAYLAGLVKGPTNYDPFLGDAERRAKATERAHERVRYVLGRIVAEDLDALAGPFERAQVEAVRAEAQRLLDEGFTLPFERGTFRYDRTVVVDEVARRLKEPPFDRILSEAGVELPETAGLVIVTTLDEAAQRGAAYGLAHHLTELGTQLEGLPYAAFRADPKAKPAYDPTRTVRRYDLGLATVSAVGDTLSLDFGGVPCTVDREGLERAAGAVVRGARQDKHARPGKADVDALLEALPVGTNVNVSVRQASPALCDLELKPAIQGAVAVAQEGQLRAMVGGSDNKDFNRARAPRQMGSTWKPLVYDAALELGWRPEDMLDNWQNAFRYGTVWYYPGADHDPASATSIALSAVNSENIASVWLLYHLTDRLSDDDFARVAEAVGVAQEPEEPRDEFAARLRALDVTPLSLDEVAFWRAKTVALERLALSAHPEDELALRSMVYGGGWDAERARVAGDAALTQGERDQKEKVLALSWTWARDRLTTCHDQYARLEAAVAARTVPQPAEVPDLNVFLDGEVLQVACGLAPPEGYAPPHPATVSAIFPDEEEVAAAPAPAPVAAPAPVTAPAPDPKKKKGRKDEVVAAPRERPKPAPDRFHQEWTDDTPVWGQGKRLAYEVDMLVDGRLHASTLQAVAAAIEPVTGDPFEPAQLAGLQDYRVLVGLRFVAELAHAYGIRTEIKELLPLPLGASEITVEEEAAMYEGLVTGLSWSFHGQDLWGDPVVLPDDATLLIREIRDAAGRVLYRAHPEARQVGDPRVGEMMADILRSVVEQGTGRGALRSAVAGRADVPLGGKTGTTNDFRNVAFLGYAPVAGPDGFTLERPWSIGAYVGYDDNRSMKVGNLAVAGANGALPVWRIVAESLGAGGRLGETTKQPEGRMPPRNFGLVRATSEDGVPVITWEGEVPELELRLPERE